MAAPRLTFKPVTKATRADFEAVFDGLGGPKYCWCMAWRDMPQRSEASNEQRRDNMLGRIDSGEPVGILGYAGGEPVAWVSIAPDSPSYRFMGFVPAFEAAGFVETGTVGSRRHVMRLTLSDAGRGES